MLLLKFLCLSRRVRSSISRGLVALARILPKTSFFLMSVSRSEEPLRGSARQKLRCPEKLVWVDF